MNTKWRIKKTDSDLVTEIGNELGLNHVVSSILVGRGLDTKDKINEWIDIGIHNLHDPFLLPDINFVVDRMKKAIIDKEKIFCFFDYDVDGVTSCCVAVKSLETLGADFIFRVPHRKEDGYDLTNKIVEEAHLQNCTLLFTGDCGITAYESIDYAKSLGIDVIITDHHLPSLNKILPKCVGIVNPHRKDSLYPFEELSGAGIVFKVMCALSHSINPKFVKIIFNKTIEFVAMSIISDVAHCVDENRALVKLGCQKMQESTNVGINALLKVSGVKKETINEHSLGFFLGPRINAIGRLDNSSIAVDLLLEVNEQKANYLANILDTANKRRQQLQATYEEEAIELVNKNYSNDSAVVIAVKGWEPGVVGLVASKITRQYGKPALCMSILPDGKVKGSGRSLPGMSLINALRSEKVSPLFLKKNDGSPICGGHELAAGFSLREENINSLRENLNEYFKNIVSEDFIINIDAAIPMSVVNYDTYKSIKDTLSPFGAENPEPLFLTRNLTVLSTSTMKEGKHLKLELMVTNSRNKNIEQNTFTALAWRRGHEEEIYKSGSIVDIVYKITPDTFRGKFKVTAEIEDICFSKLFKDKLVN